jgi:hypothetical protein
MTVVHTYIYIYSGICQEVFKEAANFFEPLIRNSNGVFPEYTYLCIFCAVYSNLSGVADFNCNPHEKELMVLSRIAIVLCNYKLCGAEMVVVDSSEMLNYQIILKEK